MTTGSRMSLGTYGSSLGTYNIKPTHTGNEEFLEMSYQTGETRRSSVQIRPAPPLISRNETAVHHFERPRQNGKRRNNKSHDTQETTTLNSHKLKIQPQR